MSLSFDENQQLVYEYHIKKQEKTIVNEKDLFYVFINVPKFWEIQAEGVNGAIYSCGIKKANIYFKEPLENRNVHRIEWLTDKGKICKIDYYGKYGYAYCSVFIREDRIVSKSYYTSEHVLVIHINDSNGVVSLYDKGHVSALFSSEKEFENFTIGEINNEKQNEL